MNTAKNIQVGDELPTITRHITQGKMTLFVDQLRHRTNIMSLEDFHTQFGIHFDEEFARSKGLPSTVAQAFQPYAYVSELMTNFFGEGWLRGGKLEMSFIKMVCPGDRLDVKGTVKEMIPEGSISRIVFDVWCENQNGEKVAVGTASGLRKRGVS